MYIKPVRRTLLFLFCLVVSPLGFSAHPHSANFESTKKLDLYFELFDLNQMVNYELRVQQTEWEEFLKFYRYNLSAERYFKADLRVSFADQEYYLDQIGFRLRGNTTRSLPDETRSAIKFSFDETFDLDKSDPDYKRLKDREFGKMDSLNLKSREIAEDQTQIRELYAYDLFNQAGLVAPLTGNAHLYITLIDPQGQEQTIDYGVYTAIEQINKSFLGKRYGSDANDGNLYKCLWQDGGPATLDPKKPALAQSRWMGIEDDWGNTPTYDLKTNKKEADFSDLLDFITQLNTLEGQAFVDYMEANFEIDDFLKTVALSTLIGMPDDYWAMGNNYYLYFNNAGKIVFIPYDYDHGFGGGWKPFDTAGINILQWPNLASEYSNQYYSQPLINKLLDIERYKQRFLHHLAQLTHHETGIFSFDRFEARFNQLKALYDPDLNGKIDNDFHTFEMMQLKHTDHEGNYSTVQDFYRRKLDAVNQLLVEEFK